MVQQYIMPLVKNAMEPMDNGDTVRTIERVLKLTVPNILVWLLGFYFFFHLYLNILSEILQYGNREFYNDFWNSTSMDRFWRTWNLPVHQWLVSHIYLPMIDMKYTQNVASFMVFFVSALFHELIICVPFRQVQLMAFMAMMIQLPFCIVTRKYTRGKAIGNFIFWLSFAMGQANLCLVYYHKFTRAERLLAAQQAA